MAQEPITNTWPGTSTFVAGKTPFGYFDNDQSFKSEVDKFAKWSAMRLGYPITDVELIDLNFYAAYEEAILHFGELLQSSQAKDILLDLKGSPLIAGTNLSNVYIKPTLKGIFKLADQYGVAGPSGGKQNWYSGSINLEPGRQVYDLTDPNDTELELGDVGCDKFTIKKVFHNRPPANRRMYGASTVGQYNNLEDFGFNNIVGNEMVMMPLNYSLQMMQAIELHDEIIKSAYSFKLTGNRFQIFPIPRSNGRLWFNYTLDSEDVESLTESVYGSSNAVISDISNIPYGILSYSALNSISRSWIRRYALAIAKEMLGLIRSKYSTLPIPDSEITLNGEALIDQARTEMETMNTELRELLDSLGHQAQMQKRTEETSALMDQLAAIPMKIYIK
jgi:hypothetical protein